jgi:hypothetical protein
MVHGITDETRYLEDVTSVERDPQSNHDDKTKESPQKEKRIECRGIVRKQCEANDAFKGVHKEQKHESAVDAHMHGPPKTALHKYPSLKEDIQDKDFQKSQDLWA